MLRLTLVLLRLPVLKAAATTTAPPTPPPTPRFSVGSGLLLAVRLVVAAFGCIAFVRAV